MLARLNRACCLLTTAAILSGAGTALAQNLGNVPYGGGGVTNIRDAIMKILDFILSFIALVAVIFIIVAGIRLIVSQGEQEQTGKARKTIIYVIIGLIVILIAKVIVKFAIACFSGSGPCLG